MQNGFLKLFPLFFLFVAACGDKIESESYDPEGSTDTRTREISYQVKRTWRLEQGALSVTNEFPGARLNDFLRENDSVYKAVIRPENGPVNKSPWYAFGIWSSEPRTITVEFNYEEGYSHRYYPDLSRDLENWQPADSAMFEHDTVAQVARLTVDVSKDTLYIAAQEVITSEDVYQFVDSLEHLTGRMDTIIGYSRLGKPLPALVAGNTESDEAVVIIGRQHPPEATGYLAMRSFVGHLLNGDSLTDRFLERYTCIIIPMLNPDGIDMGHWRHSAGGIDLNRDWHSFNQPETSAVRDFLTSWMENNNQKLLFAIDFHSTQEDLFYVFEKDRPTLLTGFTHDWLDAMEERLGDYTSDRIPTSGNSPVSTRWFHETFNAEAVTYEVGDSSPRLRIRQIGEAGAYSLMELLNER